MASRANHRTHDRTINAIPTRTRKSGRSVVAVIVAGSGCADSKSGIAAQGYQEEPCQQPFVRAIANGTQRYGHRVNRRILRYRHRTARWNRDGNVLGIVRPALIRDVPERSLWGNEVPPSGRRWKPARPLSPRPGRSGCARRLPALPCRRSRTQRLLPGRLRSSQSS